MKKLSWRALNKQINNFSEEQLLAMIETEMATHRRTTVVERMHQRYNILRMARERDALFGQLKPSPMQPS